MASEKVPAKGAESKSEFPFDSAFVDQCHRIGLSAECASEIESFWWFMCPGMLTPDDFAAAIMAALGTEDAKTASMRRMGLLNGHDVSCIPISKIKARKLNQGRTFKK